MNYVFSIQIDGILNQKGMFLNKIGVNNWALSKEDALAVLERFKNENIGILGGDVYILKDNEFEATYDNWFFQRGGTDFFVEESIEFSRNYIRNYQYIHTDNIYYVLIPTF